MIPRTALDWILSRWLDLISAALLVVAVIVGIKGLGPRSPSANAEQRPRQDVERYERAMVDKPAPVVPIGVGRVDLGASGPRLIVAGESGCVACVYSLPGWSAIAVEHRLGGAFVIVSPDSARLVPGTVAPDASTLVTRDLATIVRAFGSPAYPVTLATDRNGVVRFARIGILMPGDAESIRAVLAGAERS